MKKLLINIVTYLFTFLRGKRWYSLNNFILFQTLKNLEFGNGGDPLTSGEIEVIKMVKKRIAHPLIIDCGANRGQYAHLIIREFQNTPFRLICFEPSSETFKSLQESIEKDKLPVKGIQLENLALGKTVGKATLFSDQPISKYASLQRLDLGYTGKIMDIEEEIQITTLDQYMADRSIKKVDFLKLDVEGLEFEVLLGANKAINEGLIGIIQFEFGKTNIDTRTFFKDFYNLLSAKYKFYRVHTWGIEALPEDYLESQEIFYCVNYLAINRTIPFS
ncbi:FkbM family methyltransferase [Salibacteraceae bacterium]|nr:FkbM family methyltransferase [Salibacteraceae bacterium]MDB9709333.1 FkbM family methyltransferase [Salibacteraceae bacterium]